MKPFFSETRKNKVGRVIRVCRSSALLNFTSDVPVSIN